MNIFESKVEYEMSVILTEDEEQRYFKAFRNQSSVVIPELGKAFFIHKMEGYHWEGAPKHSWHLQIRQDGYDKIQS